MKVFPFSWHKHAKWTPSDLTPWTLTLFYSPSPPPLWLLVCRPMQKQHFWKMHFRVKNPVGQENQFLRSGFFIRWKCGAILLKGSPFFPQRTIVWNHFWKSILISEITFIHDIKVKKILEDSLDSISSPSPSVKIQIMGGKVVLRYNGKTLLGVVNKFFCTKRLLTTPSNVWPK